MKNIQSFQSLAYTAPIAALAPWRAECGKAGAPYRKSIHPPVDNGAFVLPLKQSLVKNPRLMPGTKMLLALLVGWAGHDRSVETTREILGRHLCRSARQIYRYLCDAREEGLLMWSQTANAMGYVNGIKVWLNVKALRHDTRIDRQRRAKRAETRTKQGRTQESCTNEFYTYLEKQKGHIDKFETKIAAIARSHGFELNGFPDTMEKPPS